jgi:nucleoside-diphosphate-sugar epimerase
MKKILLTGADGYLGKNILRSLQTDTIKFIKLSTYVPMNQNQFKETIELIKNNSISEIWHFGSPACDLNRYSSNYITRSIINGTSQLI